MSKPTQAKRIVPEVRGSFLRAIKRMADEGQPLSDVIYDELKKRPLSALDTLSKFVPKELLLDVEEDSALAEILKELKPTDSPSPGLPKPVDEQRPGLH